MATEEAEKREACLKPDGPPHSKFSLQPSYSRFPLQNRTFLQNGSSAPNGAPKLQVCRRRAVLQKSENTQETVHEGVCCPECGSAKVWKDGLRYLSDGATVQRYLCRSCGYRFSEPKVKLNVPSQVFKRSKPMNNLAHDVIADLDPSLKESFDNFPFFGREDVGSHRCTIIGQRLNTFRDYTSTRRVRDGEDPSKNSASQAGRGLESVGAAEKRAAGATAKAETDIKGKIVEFLWWMKKQGYAESTILSRGKRLHLLVKLGANLYDPETVKDVVARQKWKESYKEAVICAYDLFAKWLGIK